MSYNQTFYPGIFFYMKEPSVLDYVKAKLNPRKYQGLLQAIDQANEVQLELVKPAEQGVEIAIAKPKLIVLPWKTISGVLFALIAQFILEPPVSSVPAAITFYVLSAVSIGAAFLMKEIELPKLKPDVQQPMSVQIRKSSLYFGLPVAILAFLAFGGNKFNLIESFCMDTCHWIFHPCLLVTQSRRREYIFQRSKK